MIGLPTGGSLRTDDILPSIVAMDKPPGTCFLKQSALGVAKPLNIIGRAFLANPNLQWLFLTNDDNLCPRDTIPRLLSHDLDIVSGLYLGRIMPFQPIMFDSTFMRGDKVWHNRHLLQPGEHGLREAAAFGDGCLLIQRRVLETIPQPWWSHGTTVPDECDHDLTFCSNARRAGFKLWVDMDMWVDHVASIVVRPHRDENGEWTSQIVQNDRLIVLPPAIAKEKDGSD